MGGNSEKSSWFVKKSDKMIFSIGKHIKQIIEGTKIQTRRQSDKYQVGQLLAIQPGRGKTGIPAGKIKIVRKWMEDQYYDYISNTDALAEGGYNPNVYEDLYYKMYGNWNQRWAYEFVFVPSSELS